MFFTQGEPEQPQKRRYSALELNDDVFGLHALFLYRLTREKFGLSLFLYYRGSDFIPITWLLVFQGTLSIIWSG